MFGAIGYYELLVVILVSSAVIIGLWMLPAWRILAKAGYPGWFSVVVFIPLINLIALWVFAFVEWPLEQKAKAANREMPY